jgi:hypothetical protein
MAAGIRADLGADTVVGLFDQNAAATRARGATPGSMSPEQRRQLVARATFGPKATVTTKGGLMICAHPLATHAGAEFMGAGGNAGDAVFMLALIQSVYWEDRLHQRRPELGDGEAYGVGSERDRDGTRRRGARLLGGMGGIARETWVQVEAGSLRRRDCLRA